MSATQQKDTQFTIPSEIEHQYPELVKLVIATESMEDTEKQYWFDMLPSMTDEQIDKLFNILDTERQKLQELELKYQEEMRKLNEKHLIEWQEYQSKKSKAKIQEEEAKDTTEKKEAEDSLEWMI